MASSISGIGPMSMYPISSVRQVETKPQNYAVENESEVSDAFTESLAMNGVNGINGPSPVQYPNAQVAEPSRAEQQAANATRVNQFYNNVASAFQGAATSYNANGVGSQYEMVGSTIDLTA